MTTTLCSVCMKGSLEDLRAYATVTTAMGWDRLRSFADDEGRTAVHWAITGNNAALAAALLADGHGVLTSDEGGTTPLISACGVGSEVLVAAVLGASTDNVNAATLDTGATALHVACSKGNAAIVRQLIAAGADANAVNMQGQTPLHRAAGGARASVDVVEALLKAGARVNDADRGGNTALHHAAAENNQEMGECLLRRGADREAKNRAGKAFYDL